jgi:hypothetical protein
MGRAQDEFVNDRRRVRKEYDEFKARINSLDHDIRQRNEGYNAANGLGQDQPRPTWMADGTQWEGTWVDASENHRKGDHAAIVLVSATVYCLFPTCMPLFVLFCSWNYAG